MAADLAALPEDYYAPPGLEIRRVLTKTELGDFACVVAKTSSPPDPEVVRFYDLASPVLLAPGVPQWLYVGYLMDKPVATAECTIGGGSGGAVQYLHVGVLSPGWHRVGDGE